MSEKEVVVILPYREGRVLMQLRDDRQGIPCAGCWGFFGGAIEQGDTPEDTIWREVCEELEYQPTAIHQLGVGRIRDLGNLLSYAYYCHLTVPVERLHLREGMDLGLFSPTEILSKRLYSVRLKGSFPIAATTYIVETVEQLFHRISRKETSA
jgi:8-oxo-dGTP pyrophosphatase MutT (NUDIX family)